MSCNCGKIKEKNAKREKIRELAVKYQQANGGIIVFFLCKDYDFTEIENFKYNGKQREIEYIL
jgi:hypothetical protein